jgi:hypothetical protein
MPVALGATALCTAGLLGPIPRMGSDGRCSAGMGTVTLDHGFAGSIPARSATQPACLVTTAARLLGTEVVGVQFSEQAPSDRGVSG